MNSAAVTKSPRTTNHIGRTDGRPFPLQSEAGIFLPPRPHIETDDVPRQIAIKRALDHCELLSTELHEQAARRRHQS
jgi:hypothetical protein